jgi:hypothetical protein
MHRWGPRLDWEHLQNWVPGALGASAAILLVVVAANSRTQTNSKPAEVPPSQSAVVANKGQTDAPSPSRSAMPQPSPVTGTVAKAQTPAPSVSPAPATKAGDVPAPAHDHAMVKAEAVAAPAQNPAKPDGEPQKLLPIPQACKATLSPGDRSSRNVRRVIPSSQARPSWARAWPASSAASRAPNRISLIRQQ